MTDRHEQDAALRFIAEREFNQWCTNHGLTSAYRAPFKKWFVGGFETGVEIGARLAEPKRKRRDSDNQEGEQ